MISQVQIRDLVSISSADLTEVNIRRDFDDVHKINAYVPNEASRRTMAEIVPGLMPTSTKRVHLLTGTYGTGKSHFGLVLASLLRKCPEADVVLAKVREKDAKIFQLVRRHLDAGKKYLIVVPSVYLYSQGFNHALLVALKEALKRENIDFRPRSHYAVATEIIDRWQEEGLKNTEDNPYEKLSRALIARGMTPHILKDSLSKCSGEALDIFKDVYEQVAYGAVFQPDASIAPAELYAQTIEYLRSTGEWEGVWALCDEFGKYLSTLARDPSSWESQNIQQFAEYCKRSDENQCHFVVIAHQTLAEYATGLRSQEEWQKISGRFVGRELSLENVSARHETVEMISTIITRQIETDHQKDTWQELSRHSDLSILIDDLQNAGVYSDQERDWLQNTLVMGCLPLHPFATFCLPWLAQRVGQRERTLFTFFNDSSEGGLRHFVDHESLVKDDERLNLYTADRLIHYFGPAAEGRPQYRQIMRARQDALSQVGDSPLAQRLINVLAVLEIIGSGNLQPSEANLLTAMYLSSSAEAEARQLLVELSQTKVIRHRASGIFELRSRRGEFDLQEAIRKAKEELRPTFGALEALREMEIIGAKLIPIQASSYEKKHFVRRAAVRELTVPRSLSNPKEFLDRIEGWYEPDRKGYEGDVLILYTLAEDVDELEQAKRYATMEACQYPQLVIAIPQEPVRLTEILLDIAAAAWVKDRILTEPEKDEADIEELDQTIADKQIIVGKGIDDFLQADKLVWYCDGDSTVGIERDGEEEYISNLLENRFAKTPAVRDVAIANILVGRDTGKKHRHLAMTRLLEHQDSIPIKKTGGTAVDRILRACLQDTEVLEKKEDKGAYADFEVRTVLPKEAVLEEIWQLLQNRLVQQQYRVELGTVIRELLQPPCGLSHQLIEILLAAFFRNRLDEFVIFGNYQKYKKRQNSSLLSKVNLNAPSIASIVASPDEYVSIYYEVRTSEREYVNGIIALIAKEDEEAGEMGIWDRGRDALLSWFSALPAITTAAKSYQGDSTSKLVDLLKNSNTLGEAKDLFRNRLPVILDVPFSSPSDPTEEEIEKVVDRFEECYVELMNYAETQALILIQELGTKFEAEGSTRDDLATAVRNWYNALYESQRLHTFGGDAGHLKRAIEAEGSIDQRMLEDLPDAMGLGSYLGWMETTTAGLFLARTELAKQQIERWQPQTPLPSPGDGDNDGDLSVLVGTAKTQIKAVMSSIGLPDDLQRQVLEELLEELEQ